VPFPILKTYLVHLLSPWAGTAQLVECPTEKPDAILMQVRISSAGKDFSSRVNFQCRMEELTDGRANQTV